MITIVVVTKDGYVRKRSMDTRVSIKINVRRILDRNIGFTVLREGKKVTVREL